MRDLQIKNRIAEYILILYGFLWVLLTFLRLNSNVFWEDETYTIWICKKSIPDLIRTTANDVHPPLYYLMVKGFVSFFGDSGIVYHMVSVLAYIVLVALAVTVVRRLVGTAGSFLFITFASVLDNTVVQNTEVRMYSWALAFVLITYLSVYYIFTKGDKKYYCIYALAILSASYTHYYAFIAVAILVAGVLLYSLINKSEIKYLLVADSVAAIGYMPWLIVLYKTFRVKKDDYWIQRIPRFIDCMKYVFKSNMYIEYTLLILIILAGIFCIKSDIFERCDKAWWIIGFATIVGTAVIGIGVSVIFRPLFQEKYMYPAIAMGWVMLIYALSHIKGGKYATYAIILALLVVCGRQYIDRIKYEKALQCEQDDTFAKLDEIIDEDTLIVFDPEAIKWRSVEYYFNGTEYKEINEENNIRSDWNNTRVVYLLKNGNENRPDNAKEFVFTGRIGTDLIDIYL